MRPIDNLEPMTFTYAGETYKQITPNEFLHIKENGEEVPVTTESDELMDALLGGEIVDNQEE
jgi:hypothetical protein